MQTRVEVVVYGVVQGVGFRYHTCQQAQSLRVVGYVRNRPEGTVEIVAEGEAEAVQALVSWAEDGPPAAQVSQVNAAARPPQHCFSQFSIER